jgi:carboxypeptidase Taq
MNTSRTPAYDALARNSLRVHRLGHLQSIASWDRAANMPPGGGPARAEALAEMSALLHGMVTDPRTADDLDRAEQEPLDDVQQANLRELRRHWAHANALPSALVERRALAAARSEQAWRSLRPSNDWAGFLPHLRDVLAVAREEAEHLSQRFGLSRYDALLDHHEPGMTSATLDRVFGEVRSWLPGLIDQVIRRQAASPPIEPTGPFPVPAQRDLCEAVMKLLQFDFSAGRLDVSAHPFSGGVPEDVRLTTRYREDEFLVSLMGTIHETGHGRYEQNRPRDWLGQPISQSRSMGLHESQSLSFEMQLGGHPGFAHQLAPLVRASLGNQPAFEANNLHRLITRVKRGLIRVDADEVTYPAHVILRYEIERALIEGDAQPEDVPAMWDERMRALLGIDTRGNYRDGPMQDIHWSEALFGYFPCYSLGAMYAAQWFAAMRRDLPDLDAGIARGDIGPVFDWLESRIWRQGSRWTTDELAIRASGEPLNPAHFRAHLEQRYLS